MTASASACWRRESPKEALWFPVPMTGLCVDMVVGCNSWVGPGPRLHPFISPALQLAHSCSPNYSPGSVWGRGGGWFQWRVTPESYPLPGSSPFLISGIWHPNSQETFPSHNFRFHCGGLGVPSCFLPTHQLFSMFDSSFKAGNPALFRWVME